jgi:hypothetical protein
MEKCALALSLGGYLVDKRDHDWKHLYSDAWEDGSKRVNNVLTLLNRKLRRCKVWVTSQYSLDTGYIEYSTTHERHEPDLEVRLNDKVLGYVEVSGSAIHLCQEDIYVLESKLDAANKRKVEAKVETFFILVYLDQTVVLSRAIVERNRERVRVMNFRGRPESYICIAQREVLSVNFLSDYLDRFADRSKEL